MSLVVVIITLILLIIFSPIASRTDPIFATSADNDVIIKGKMDEAHKFSIRFNSSIIEEIKPRLRWNMLVWIEAEPKVLQSIEKVSYLPYWGFGDRPINRTSFEDKFALPLEVGAGPIINATVYFKDNKNITYDGFKTFVTIPPSSEIFKLNISYQNLTVTLDGRTDAAIAGNITDVTVSWGDGESAYGNFPLNHTYAKNALYRIIVTANTTKDLSVSDSIDTIGFSPDNEERINAKLALYTNQESLIKSQAVKEDKQFTLSVYGNLSEYVGSRGIPHKDLYAAYYSTNPQQIQIHDWTITTGDNGHYDKDLPIRALPAGLYKLVISGTHNYSSISQSADILVPASQLTINDIFATSGIIIGVASGLSGLISAFAVYAVSRLRMKNLGNAMTRIVNEYKKYKKTTDQADKYKYIDRFENMREEFLEMLQKGKTDENKY